MTSRVSYFKLIRNNAKRRIWYGALVFLSFFFVFPLNAMLKIENLEVILRNYKNQEERIYVIERLKESFQQLVGGGNGIAAFFVVAAALLGAWSGLYWLHSKKKMDLIGSLPIRREKLFGVELLTTALLFLIAYTLNLLSVIFIGMGKGLLTVNDWTVVLIGVGLHFFYFLIFYLCAALAMVLTGKIMVGILATGVLLAIGSGIHEIFVTYARTFWVTYVSGDILNETVTAYLSPIGIFMDVTSKVGDWYGAMNQNIGIEIPLMVSLAMGIGFAVLNIWLIRIRPAEAAQQSIAFPKIEGIVKACVLYPLGLGGGLFFQALGEWEYETIGNAWLWFGIGFSVIIGSILIEIIYHFDRKRIFRHNACTISAIGVVFLTAGIFVFDLVGYDKWLPNPEEIAHAVACTDAEYYRYQTYGTTPEEGQWMGTYMEEHIEEFQGQAVYPLAQAGVNSISFMKDKNIPAGNWSNVVVTFQLQDGTIKSRKYVIQDQDLLTAKQALYTEESYKKAIFPILLLEPQNLWAAELTRLEQTIRLNNFSQQEMQQLITVYQEELKQLDYLQIYQVDNSSILIGEMYPLNANFTRTMELLKAKGISADLTLQQVPITEITIENWGYIPEEEIKQEETVSDLKYANITAQRRSVSDPNQIEILKQNLVYSGNIDSNVIHSEEFQHDLEIRVRYLTESGELISCSAYYKKGTVPELVDQLLRQSE